MVAPTLVDELIDSGRRVIETLAANHLAPEMAFWLYVGESERWRLYLVYPEMESLGPRALYRKIQPHMSTERITLTDVSVVAPSDPLAKALKGVLRMSRGSESGVRISSSSLNGIFIDEAYIYRL